MKNILFRTAEGRILLAGFVLAATYLALTGYFLFTDFPTAKLLVLVLIAHLMGSRAGGIGICILNGFGPVTTIVYNFYIEIVIVCFTYSGFVLSTTNYLKVEWVKRFMDQLAQKALEKKDKIQKWGWVGIFSFVMAPLPVTGPVVGSIIGYMLRMRLVSNFTATALGTLSAIVLWCYGFDFLEERFQMIQYVFAAIVVIVLIPYIRPVTRFVRACARKEPPTL